MSTQQKLTTFLRHFLYSRGKSPNKLLSMTLNELLLEIGLSNELLLKQSEADIKVFSNKLNKHYRNQLKSNLLQKKINDNHSICRENIYRFGSRKKNI